MTKRVNITISEEEYKVLEKLGNECGLLPTTLAGLFVKGRIEDYKDLQGSFRVSCGVRE